MTEPIKLTSASEGVSYTQIPNHIWQYAKDHALLHEAAEAMQRYLVELAARGSIPLHTVEARAKSLNSYEEKDERKRVEALECSRREKKEVSAKPINDCVAARVIVFTTRARNDFAELLEAHTTVIERQNPGDRKHNGYDSEHLVITGIRNTEDFDRYESLQRFFSKYKALEIQIRSVAGHAWAEYEHDVRYKSGAYKVLPGDGKKQIDQWFIEAGGMRRFMDELFEKIESRLITLEPSTESSSTLTFTLDDINDETVDDDAIVELNEESLKELIQTRFSEADFGDLKTMNQISNQLAELNVVSVGELENALGSIEEGQVARLMDYPGATSAVRRLDDELLAIFTDRYVDTATDDERQQFLRLRLRRVLGKFAIYSIHSGQGPQSAMTAARTVRELARIVMDEKGPEAACVRDAIATEKTDLNRSTNARLVKSTKGSVYVATNFTRAWAESVMNDLLASLGDDQVYVSRAGDRLFPERIEGPQEEELSD